MLGRKKTSKNGKTIPQDWVEALSRLMNQTYAKKNLDNARYFDVYGQIFPEEMLVVVSWLSEKDPSVAPIACFLSAGPDQLETVDKIKETQKSFIDLFGLFFDEIFGEDDWNEFEPLWQEVTYKQQNYFYKITRENINLTLEADRLLGPGFEDDDVDLEH